MTRFGRWFAGALALLLALFVVALAMPRGPGAHGDDDAPRAKALAAPDAETARPITSHSGLTIPVAGVQPDDLTDTFGDPRGEGGTRWHGALDIMAPRGTPVLAAADGTVEKLFESQAGGHTIYIRSPNRRNVYYYAHLDTYAAGVREGAVVRAGQPVATVGSSGDADPAGPHLHFAITRVTAGESPHDGRPIDPYPLLAGRAGGG